MNATNNPFLKASVCDTISIKVPDTTVTEAPIIHFMKLNINKLFSYNAKTHEMV